MKCDHTVGTVAVQVLCVVRGVARECILTAEDRPWHHGMVQTAHLDLNTSRHTCQVQSQYCQLTEFAFLSLLQTGEKGKKSV